MFKRANKITSLLVAAAAVISLVPAGVSASEVKKVNSEDGTVYDAVAYKDGKFYIDGEIEDKDEATFYLADGEYTELEDVDTGSDITTYGSKYINVEDGDYFVDLETGKATDDSIKEDAEDDAASALRKKVKGDTDGRYVEGTGANESEVIQDLENAQLPGNKFGDIWYGVKYSNHDATNNIAADTAASLNVYTDEKGNYIDADFNLGKIKVTTTEAGASKTVSVENTDDTYDADATADAVSANVTSATVIGQDKDYIYRTATVEILTKTGVVVKEINGVAVSTGSAFTQTAGSVQFNVIQKISKAQDSDDIGGAKFAKTVTTYVISKDDGTDKSSDLFADYTVVNGKLVNYKTSGTKVYAQTITLKSKNGFYYTDFADAADEDVETNDSQYGYAVETDVDGNLWRLDGGYIYQWDNDEDWNKVYKVDGSFDKLSVYDKDNMVAWNEDDEVYSVIGGTTTPDDTTVETPVVTAGWAQAANGAWTYNKADGTKATGWLLDGATWYYLKADGVMATGWVLDGATWYYTNASGAMATGWVNDNGTWYYCNASGAMLANTTVDGYVLGASGAWVK
ncbi:cell wall-binding protein [Clostridium beijerinckii]|nr:cell wall-binding protein [Clostridium beijerinckii]